MLKKLKIGFAAIIAVLAVTATIASHAGAFNGKLTKVAFTDGCYVGLTTQNPNSQTYTQGDACPSSLPLNVNVLSVGGAAPLADPEFSCPIDPTKPLCCIEIEADKVVGFRCGEFRP